MKALEISIFFLPSLSETHVRQESGESLFLRPLSGPHLGLYKEVGTSANIFWHTSHLLIHFY